MLDNDSLLQIFSLCRLNHGENWNITLTWRKLTHICRRWRYLIYDTWCFLDLRLLVTNDSPSLDKLGHLPPLPLVIDYSDRTGTMARKDEDNIYFGLQQHGSVLRVALRAPSSSLRMFLESMDKLFPRLGDLSLLSTTFEEMNLVLPETFQAPDLRHLALQGIGLPTKLPLLSSAIALSTLSLTHIGASCYFPPGQLVTRLQGLPHLEELSIGFAIPIPSPSNEGELLPAPIPPVTLPSLRRLTFRGVGVYLDNLVAQINTPLLERLGLTLHFELVFTLVNLTEFILRTEGIGCLLAKVIFSKDGASIDMGYYEQEEIGKLSLHVNCEPLDWQIDSATQVCVALGGVLSAIEELTLDIDANGVPADWENTLDDMLWHDLLLPFVGVKKLRIGSSLTLELSQALKSVAGGLVLELLPVLEELDVPVEVDHAMKAFSGFIETRVSVGRPIQLLAPTILLHAMPQDPRAEPQVSRSRVAARVTRSVRSVRSVAPTVSRGTTRAVPHVEPQVSSAGPQASRSVRLVKPQVTRKLSTESHLSQLSVRAVYGQPLVSRAVPLVEPQVSSSGPQVSRSVGLVKPQVTRKLSTESHLSQLSVRAVYGQPLVSSAVPHVEPQVSSAEPRVSPITRRVKPQLTRKLSTESHLSQLSVRAVYGQPLVSRAVPHVEPQVQSAEPQESRTEPQESRAEPQVPRTEPQFPLADPEVHHMDPMTFLKYMYYVGRPYRNRAMNLISICRTFIQSQKQTSLSYDALRR